MTDEFKNELEILIKRESGNLDRDFVPRRLSSTSIRELFDIKYEVNTKRDETGVPIPGSGRLITAEEKKLVLDYMVNNDLPMSKKVYYFILKGYVNNEISLDEEKHLKM